VEEIEAKLEKLLARQKELEKEVDVLRGKLSTADLSSIFDNARTIAGTRVLAAKLPIDSAKTMREVGDKVRDRLGSGIAVLGAVFQGKANILVIVSQDLTKRYHAGQIVKVLAETVGGSGGGRADMAQAGGPIADKLDEALEAAFEVIEKNG
jgi:alanyl-tRNA synthetase